MTSTENTPKTRGRPRSFDRGAALEQAMQLFWRHGYESTSIGMLTAAMGITPPSLYSAFGDKERLFLEAIEHYRTGPGNAAKALGTAQSARDAIRCVLESSARELTQPHHPPGCMVVLAALSGSEASAHIRSALADIRLETEAFFASTIGAGVESGELPADTDVRALAKFAMTVLQGMTIQARDGASHADLLRVAAAAMRAWPPARRRTKTAKTKRTAAQSTR